MGLFFKKIGNPNWFAEYVSCLTSDLNMRYVSAYLLAVLGGNESPSAADLKNILDSVGIEVDDDLAGKVVNNLKGKSLDELMAEGMSKLATMPSGGGGGGGSAGGAAAGGDGGAEEKKEESESESDDDMGFDLFG